MAIKIGNKTWKCSECGNIITADNPPLICPMCEAEDAYYAVTNEEE